MFSVFFIAHSLYIAKDSVLYKVQPSMAESGFAGQETSPNKAFTL